MTTRSPGKTELKSEWSQGYNWLAEIIEAFVLDDKYFILADVPVLKKKKI